MKKGFTLVELLATITILAIIMVLVVPTALNTISGGKQNAYDLQVAKILAAAQDYTMDNKSNTLALRTIGGYYDVSLENLGTEGYLDIPISNPKTNTNFDAVNTYVTIHKKTTGDYSYTLGTGSSMIALIGANPVTLVCSATGNYTDPGAAIIDQHNTTTGTVYSTETIALNMTGSNLLHYTYTNSQSEVYNIARSVLITNSNIPTIAITGGVSSITIFVGGTYTAPTATATDLCEGSLTVTTTSNVVPTIAGTYTITYTATNKGNISGTATVTVNVVDPFLYQISLAGKISAVHPYIKNYDAYLTRYYTLNSSGTIVMYQSSPLALPNGAIDGYRTLPITGATFLTGYSTEYVMTLNSSKQVVQNYCAYNATTCTSSILTDFVSNNVQISATDAYVKNYTAYLKRIYALKTDGTVQLYQSSPLALPSGAIDGYRTLPITGAKMISAYTTEDVLTINSSKQIVQYTCPYNATTCTSSILTDFGSNNVQVSGNSEYIKSYTTYLNRIYTLKADGTVQLYQASNINLPNGGVDGYRTLPITGAKAIAAFGSEELLVLNSSNQVVKYSCLYNTTTCTSTILTDFGTL